MSELKINPDTAHSLLPAVEDAARADVTQSASLARGIQRDARSLAGDGVFARMRGTLSDWGSRLRGTGAHTFGDEAERGAGIASASRDRDLTKSAQDVRTDSQNVRNMDDPLAEGNARAGNMTDASGRGWSRTDFIAGVAGVTLITFALASFIATDGARLNINDIIVLNGGLVRVDYDVVSSGDGGLISNFVLRVGDYVTFDQPTPTSPNLTGEQQVVQTEGDHTFYIRPNPALQTAGGLGVTPASVVGSPAYSAPIGSSYWHQATVSSSFTGQLGGQVTDAVQFLGSAASAVLVTTVNALTPGLVTVATTAANTAANLAAAVTPAGISLIGDAANAAGGAFHALTPALGGAFCDVVPFACNSTLWWSVGGICLCLIIVAIIMKVKGR